ncbi:aminotransferase class III-fold pyridoxal phosphate-dependent enzyme [Saxibacter everestensis]|uniref:Aminotransferase class III-fold pyridoxal phosphate-dependent enzyme n=1 Tax=Saxibacter everestensis TaxID=2909229 RepID=A0ABY8R0C5_9MICO|nr:aminotransferase class III-fold pyridoxal phosphate-dependent enzyme [Brevibacteriaceae bacterium ZFBP1038]
MSTSFWHPQAMMSTVKNNEIVIDRGEGSYLWTEDGTKLLDATAALWYANIGHGRPEIATAVAKQMQKLEHYQTFDKYATRPTLELCDRIVDLAPFDDGAKVLLGSGGSDAIETAAKLARRYFTATGRPDKRIIISRQQAYHGLHGHGTSLGWLPANREGYGELDPAVLRASATDWHDVEKTIMNTGPELIAAFFCEPVIGTGGVIFPGAEYLAEVRELCRKHDILFVSDEVITGFGRTGKWFASERFDLQPDMMTFAKGVTSGYLPLGGLVVAPHVAEPFFADEGSLSFRHGVTYSGHAAVCAAALANIDVLERENLVQRVASLETVLADALAPLAELDGVIDVRAGVGLLGAVELRDAQLANKVEAHGLGHGVLLRKIVGGNVIQISPPFIITEDEIQLIADTIAAALGE